MNSSQASDTLESMSQAIWYNQWTLKLFIKYLRGSILEVGCGIGNFTKTLTKYGQVTSIDINKDYLDSTKQLVKGKALIGYGNIEKGDYFFKDKKFDTVICLNVLEHIKDDQKVLKNLNKLIRTGGLLILLVPAHKSLFSEIDKAIGHYRRYHKDKLLKDIKHAGFNILKSRRLNFLGAIGWFWAGKILRQKTVDIKNIKIFNLFAPIFLSLEGLLEPPIGTSLLIIAKKFKQ